VADRDLQLRLVSFRVGIQASVSVYQAAIAPWTGKASQEATEGQNARPCAYLWYTEIDYPTHHTTWIGAEGPTGWLPLASATQGEA